MDTQYSTDTRPPARPLEAVPQDISPTAELRCFRVVWISHSSWQIDVWAESPDAAIRAVQSGMDYEAFTLVGCIDLATTR